MTAKTVPKANNLTAVHLFFTLQKTNVVVHNKEGGTYEGSRTYAHAGTFFLPYGATSSGEQVACAMNLGSVQSSPGIGSAAICPAYAKHIVYQTRHSPPSSTSSRRHHHIDPTIAPLQHGHHIGYTIPLVKKYQV